MKLIFLCCLFLLSHTLYAQDAAFEKKIDALKSQISQSEGAEKLRLTDSLILAIEFNEAQNYSSIIQENIALGLSLDSITSATRNTANFIYYQNVYKSDFKSGLETFLNFKGNEITCNEAKPKVNLYLYGADSHMLLGDFDLALEVLDKAKEYAFASQKDHLIAPVYYRIGFIQSRAGDLAEASVNMQKARNLFLKINDTLQYVNANIALATLYDLNEFFDEAKLIRDETIEISKQAKDKPSLSILYLYQAGQYDLQDKQKDRIEYLKLALDAVETSVYKDYYKPGIVFNSVIAYAQNDSIEKADALLSGLDEYPNSKTPEFQGAIYIETLKELAFAKENYSEALVLGRQHLALKKEQDNFEDIYNAEKFMATVYSALGDTINRNEHLVAYYSIKDSLTSVKKTQTLSYYQTIYETEKRDLKIQAQESDIALLDERNKVKNQWLLFGGLGLLGMFAFFWVLRSRNFARRRQRLQENFTKDILKTQENERARIASELHDSVGQKLLMLKNSLTLNKTEKEKEIDLVGETIKEVREMSHNLHPFQFEKLGLITSLKNMVETFQKNSNVFYSEDINLSDGLISKEKEIYVFRMLQEAMTNVEKHADATACNLQTDETKNEVIFVLKDNGKGFTSPENLATLNSLGMKTIQERARFIEAKVVFTSAPAKGTTVTLKIPKR